MAWKKCHECTTIYNDVLAFVGSIPADEEVKKIWIEKYAEGLSEFGSGADFEAITGNFKRPLWFVQLIQDWLYKRKFNKKYGHSGSMHRYTLASSERPSSAECINTHGGAVPVKTQFHVKFNRCTACGTPL